MCELKKAELLTKIHFEKKINYKSVQLHIFYRVIRMMSFPCHIFLHSMPQLSLCGSFGLQGPYLMFSELFCLIACLSKNFAPSHTQKLTYLHTPT